MDTITKCPCINVCVRCEDKFTDWKEYNKHIAGPKCQLKTVPWKEQNNVQGGSHAEK